MTTTVFHNLNNEVAAARALLVAWRATLADDEQAQADTIEGATNLHEALQAGVGRLAEIETLKLGIVATIEILGARLSRLKHQEQTLRTAMLGAMEIGAIRRLETPLATVSRKAVPPSVVITDSNIIPAEYLKLQPPTLDRLALARALKAGPVSGAALSNGGETIAVKWS